MWLDLTNHKYYFFFSSQMAARNLINMENVQKTGEQLGKGEFGTVEKCFYTKKEHKVVKRSLAQ